MSVFQHVLQDFTSYIDSHLSWNQPDLSSKFLNHLSKLSIKVVVSLYDIQNEVFCWRTKITSATAAKNVHISNNFRALAPNYVLLSSPLIVSQTVKTSLLCRQNKNRNVRNVSSVQACRVRCVFLQTSDSCDIGGSWKEVLTVYRYHFIIMLQGMFFPLLPHYPGGLWGHNIWCVDNLSP